MWAVWCGKCQLSPKTQVKPTDGWFCYKQDQSPYCVWWAWVELAAQKALMMLKVSVRGWAQAKQAVHSFLSPAVSPVHIVRQALCQRTTLQVGGAESAPRQKYPWNHTSGPYRRTRRTPLRITDPDSIHPFEANPWQAVSSSERAPQGCCDVPTFHCRESHPNNLGLGLPPHKSCAVFVFTQQLRGSQTFWSQNSQVLFLCRLQLQILTMFENKTGSRFKHLCVQTF